MGPVDCTILAIDGNPESFSRLQAALVEAYPRARLVRALDGAEALDLAAREEPDVVLLDGGADGRAAVAVCRSLKADPRIQHLPVVMIVGAEAAREHRVLALEAGADALVAHPLDGAEVAAQVRAMLRIKFGHDREREWLRLVTETSPTGIIVLDGGGTIIFANAHAERALGMTRKSMDGLRYNSPTWSITSFDGTRFPDADLPFARVAATRQPVYGVRHAITRADGARVLLYINAAPILTPDGRFSGVVTAFEDVTHLHQAQEALRRNERSYRDLVTALPDAVIRFDPDGRLLYASANADQVLGIPSGYNDGRTLSELGMPAERLQYWGQAIRRVFSSGEASESELIVDDGAGGRVYDHRLIPERDDEGVVRSVLSLSRDVTRQREAEREIRRLVSLNRVLGRVNEAIVRAGTREELFEAVCRIAGEHGNFDLTWISIQEAGVMRVAACYAADDAYREQLRPAECSMHMDAVRQERAIVCNHVVEDSTQPACHLHAVLAGIKSCASFPIRAKGAVCGVLSVHSPEPDYFRDEEVVLLEEIAIDISYALDKLEAEKSRQEVEERFAVAFERFPAPAALSTIEDGVYLQVNLQFESVLGYKRDEVVGRSSLEIGLFTAERRAELLAMLREKGRLTDVECPMRAKDGREHNFLLNVEVVRLGGRECLLVMMLDITERKQASLALEERNHYIETILENSPIGFAVNRFNDGEALFVSRKFEEIYGIDRTSLRTVDDFFAAVYRDPEFRRQMKERVLADIMSGDPSRMKWEDIPIADEAGQRRYVTATNIPLTGQNLMVSTVQDVTERWKAVHALRENQERYRALFESSYDAVIHSAPDGRIFAANAEACRMFGLSEKEICRRGRAGLIDPADSRLAALLEERARTGKASGELTFIRADGTRFPGEVSSMLFTDREGNVQSSLIIRDITSRKTAEAERERLEQQLRQAQKLESIGRLAGGVAHDFNNLLTVINGYSELLLGRLPEHDPARKELQQIAKAGRRGAELTGQLLAFSRKRVIDPKPVCLNSLLQEWREMLRRILGEDVELVLDLHPQAGWVMADPGQLHQVLLNLAVNARDAMPTGGRLTLSTSRAHLEPGAALRVGAAAGDYILLRVTDTGIGMTEEVRHRAFEPFFTTKGEGQGTGLGLATVYGIVHQAGGWVQVESDPGAGCTFVIGLPRREQAPAEARVALTAEGPSGAGETVLVVEDQEEVRGFAVTVLKHEGYRTLEARSGDDALRVLESAKGPVHLMLTDVIMPGMTGRELAERVLAARPEIKVLYMSGYDAGELGRPGSGPSAGEWIPKPFTPEELTNKVRSLLGQGARARRVLVVDDEASVRSYFTAVLTGAGYQVETANDGAEAERALSSGAYDLVITDLVMPKQEGIETIRAIKKRYPNIRIAVLSGAFGGEFLRVAARLGADATLEKPVSPEQLLEMARRLLA